VIEADSWPGILARELGSMLQKAREVVGLSYDQAAARLGRTADWLVRVETGFAVAGPDEVARILVAYGVREARVADTIIDMARRAAAPPPWLAAHTSRLSAASRDVLSFAGTTDRIGVSYGAVIGAELAPGSLHDLWARIEDNSAADLAQSRAILERHLAAAG
jgi:transcriptional regulator with XRE-family HTH domain